MLTARDTRVYLLAGAPVADEFSVVVATRVDGGRRLAQIEQNQASFWRFVGGRQHGIATNAQIAVVIVR